jgi:dGTPase
MEWSRLFSAQRLNEKKPSDKNYLELRSRFEQDYDRIIFSDPFRRLQDKTQVFPLPEDDFVHTRLTHSLEVSSVGRSLGKNIGHYLTKKYPDLSETISPSDVGAMVGAACLAHDLGNPPFGHSGEDFMSAFYKSHPIGQSVRGLVSEKEWSDLCDFEGNAQGFRILNGAFYGGLQLTAATLGAFTKYPLSSSSDKDPKRKSQKKFGYFQSEKEHFIQVAECTGLIDLGEDVFSRHPLAFLVEAADDICYHIIDLEDGCRLGLISLDEFKDLLIPIIGKSYSEPKFKQIPIRDMKLGSLRALAIAALIRQCTTIFIENEDPLLSGSFDNALVDSTESRSSLDEIIKISIQKIYRSKSNIEKEVTGAAVIYKLLESFASAAIRAYQEKAEHIDKKILSLLPEQYSYFLKKSESLYASLQLINDFVSGLSDSNALRVHRILTGKLA